MVELLLLAAIALALAVALGKKIDYPDRWKFSSGPDWKTPTVRRLFSSLAAATTAALAGHFLLQLKFNATLLLALLAASLRPLLRYSRAEKRKEKILAEFPYLLDLVSLAMKAGMSFLQSLAATTQALPSGPLADEIARLLDQLRHGERLVDTFESLARRLKMPEIGAFVQALAAAHSLGTDLAQTIHAQADLQRSLAFTRQEKRAQTAPVRMMLPLFVFIFPTIFIVIFAPICLVYL